jgi:hypothetical protein
MLAHNLLALYRCLSTHIPSAASSALLKSPQPLLVCCKRGSEYVHCYLGLPTQAGGVMAIDGRV